MILQGNALDLPLADESVQCVVTSPPYWGLRDYGIEGQLGIEPTPEAYVANLVAVFREVRRVLRADGTVWLNIGDSYAGSGKGSGGYGSDKQRSNRGAYTDQSQFYGLTPLGLKPKDLCGIPWRVAFALQADGWWLRSDIIWAKPNPMPESVKDRPTRSHEYLFLLTKSARYYYDAQAIAEPVADSTVARLSQPTLDQQVGSTRANGGAKTNGNMKAVPASWHGSSFTDPRDLELRPDTSRKPRWPGIGPQHGAVRDRGEEYADMVVHGTRNKRDVWRISTQGYSGAHFAVMPEKVAETCILAGSKPGDVVLDPFSGAGTTALVAAKLNRHAVGVELSEEYIRLANGRMAVVQPVISWL